MALTNSDPPREVAASSAGEVSWDFLLRLIRLCRGSLPELTSSDATLMDELRDCLALTELCVLRAVEDGAAAKPGAAGEAQ